MATTGTAIEALRPLRDAGSGRPLIEQQWIRNVRVQNQRVLFELALPGYAAAQRDRIAREAREALLALDGIEDVQIELFQDPHGRNALPQLTPIPAVRQVVAVSSGKGGVGKSTVAVNLACALAARGQRVGLLDADIYGPNVPTMLGVADRTPEALEENGQQILVPLESCGLRMVSMGLLINPDQPVIWRGPMLNGVIRQFLYQVRWGELDLLVVDLPPGTGDAQLSLAQAVPMEGALVVTTPQMVSLQDARRGLAMFRQMGVPVLGVVENMSYFVPPDLPDRRYELFGSGGGRSLAEEFSVPLLAQLPMDMPLMEGGDRGMPAVVERPDCVSGLAFQALADRLTASLSGGT
ncbi:MAG: MRP family ATP-binding protein [Aphanocapsa feldmannii 277cV]|uniref:Iron-sulfur cluster carrier protein n=2 Tax=Aphanocapsa feldmannii TaxID=192050 RepID=A0A524RLI5_9CHRO|nr:MAG: MRP family ATP-binding protein [Aphanocapsa feldmannii 288cV]TGG90934.1 MAG: MRP family ATP-binding protein [Aphanocapsa feldmannii 277cV]TGH22994.1 MAG: MRP family ATP-binding protein [Aphanocapsa feldmannii 277cI]